jgi:phospholipase/carboxylesterase
MNRLQSAYRNDKATTGPLQGPRLEVGSGVFSRLATRAPASYFAPLHYESNYAYPIVVWLHGTGDDEGQLKRVMPEVSLRNYVGLGLRGTAKCTSPRGAAGYTWPQSSDHLACAEQALFDAVDEARKKFHVSPRRVFIAGFDSGGTMAFRLAMSHPTRFAGVLSLGGEFPMGGTPLVRLADARRVPIFLATGRTSQKYPAATVCQNLKLFHAAGMNVDLRQYPCGDELMTMMLADMDRWIMRQITAAADRQTCPHGK